MVWPVQLDTCLFWFSHYSGSWHHWCLCISPHTSSIKLWWVFRFDFILNPIKIQRISINQVRTEFHSVYSFSFRITFHISVRADNLQEQLDINSTTVLLVCIFYKFMILSHDMACNLGFIFDFDMNWSLFYIDVSRLRFCHIGNDKELLTYSLVIYIFQPEELTRFSCSPANYILGQTWRTGQCHVTHSFKYIIKFYRSYSLCCSGIRQYTNWGCFYQGLLWASFTSASSPFFQSCRYDSSSVYKLYPVIYKKRDRT